MSEQRKPLTSKQTKIVKAKIKAELNNVPQQVAAQEVYPNQTPASAAVSMSRELRKANVQEELAKAFEEHGITIDAAIKPIADGLTADKVHIVGNGDQAMAEEAPDHSIRLKAAGMALNLMGIGKQSGDVTINFISHSSEKREAYDL